MVIPSPIKQTIAGIGGVYEYTFLEQPPISVAQFRTKTDDTESVILVKSMMTIILMRTVMNCHASFGNVWGRQWSHLLWRRYGGHTLPKDLKAVYVYSVWMPPRVIVMIRSFTCQV